MAITNLEAGRRIWDAMIKVGFTEAGAAGILGNIYAESAFKSTNLQGTFEKKLGYTDEQYTGLVDNGLYSNFVYDGAGYGLCQWTYWSRKKNLYDYAASMNVSIGDEAMQIKFFLKELAGYSNLMKTLKSTTSVKDASTGMMLQFERPADQSEANQARRLSMCEEIYSLFASKKAEEKKEEAKKTVGKVITASSAPPSAGGIPIAFTFKCHPRNYLNSGSQRLVKYVVFHYTGNPKDTAYNNARHFCNNAGLGASAHYFVDESNIEASVAAYFTAYHCGAKSYVHSACRNANSIGIEMCCSGNFVVSEKTKRNAAYLGAEWCKIIGIGPDDVDAYVLRHFDVTGKLCPKQMATKNNAEWTAFKKMIKDILRSGSVNMTSPAVITALSDMPQVSYPAVPFTVKIAATELNVRSGPGTTFDISHAPLPKDGAYTIIETSSNGWGKLKSGVGWISLAYVDIGATASGESVIPEKSVRDEIVTVRVTASKLNVRVGPGTEYAISSGPAYVTKGDVYTIVETQNGWGKLKSGAGWICMEYVEKM